MKTLIIKKNHGAHEKALILKFASIYKARQNGYKCLDEHFVLDTKNDIEIKEMLYAGNMQEHEEYLTLIRNVNHEWIRVFSDKFVDVEIQDVDVNYLRKDREIVI